MEEITRYVLIGLGGYFALSILFFLFFYERLLNRKDKKMRDWLYDYLLNNPLPEPVRSDAVDGFEFKLDDKHLWIWDNKTVALFCDMDILMCSFCGDIPARIKMKKIKKIIKEKTNG